MATPVDVPIKMVFGDTGKPAPKVAVQAVDGLVIMPWKRPTTRVALLLMAATLEKVPDGELAGPWYFLSRHRR